MNADSLLHWLLRTSLEASLLILAVLGLRLMLGTRLSPAWRIGLWMLVGVKLMLPAFIPAGFGLGGWFQREEAPPRPAALAVATDVPADFATTANVNSVAMISDRGGAVAEPERKISAYTWALVVWLMGALCVFMAALYRQRLFSLALRQRPTGTAPLLRALVASLCRKAGIQKTVRVLLLPAGSTPAVVGIAQPSILLPEDWETRFDEGSLRHVLLHELLHVKQHDLIWNWVATAVQALHWFNPLVWFVVSRFQADRELRCDAGALAMLSPTERLDYGHTLLRIQETFFAPPAMAGLAPCVRNHPTLSQRIHMIAHPTARQPVLQLMLAVTLSALVCYSFTTARAVEKEVPAKERTRDGARAPAEAEKPAKTGTGDSEGESKKPGMREGDGGTKKTGMRDGEGGSKKTGMRDGDGGAKKTGARDGEGGVKKPGTGDGEGARKTGARDGEGGARKPGTGDGEGASKTGARDGEGGARKPGTGDGERARKTGARDGEGGARKPGTGDGEGAGKTGARDGDGGTKRAGARDGDRSAASGKAITLRVIKNGEAVMVGDEEVAMNRLRGHLSTFLPEHPGAKIIVTGEGDVPMSAMNNTVDAVRDNGNKNVGIQTE
ncbi:M56 family metallopeptidase [Prosthecobacter sp.]|uniref:M56 family metallopeptidase n=1 Tax=Prosthecobacter sp. TaxID=1965333 RepID=UPI0037840780